MSNHFKEDGLDKRRASSTDGSREDETRRKRRKTILHVEIA